MFQLVWRNWPGEGKWYISFLEIRFALLLFSSIRVRSLIKKQSIVRYRLKIYIFFFIPFTLFNCGF